MSRSAASCSASTIANMVPARSMEAYGTGYAGDYVKGSRSAKQDWQVVRAGR